MRILHLGTGYPPITGGGLTLYAMGLMAAQAAAGHSVHYLCVGAFDLLFATRRVTWPIGSVQVHEIRNPRSDSIHIGRNARPALDLGDRRTECLVDRVLDEVRPDVVHIQSLLGWPASVVGPIKDGGYPAILTVQNYQGLCPTTRLYDEVGGEVCEDFAGGRRCVRCNAARPSAAKLRNAQRLTLGRRDSLRARLATAAAAAARRLRAAGHARPGSSLPAVLPAGSSLSEAFPERRRAFVAALNRVDLVVGMSHRVSELLARYGVEESRLRTLNLVLGDLERIERRPPRVAPRPVRFGLLNKLTHLKGADVLRQAWEGLDPAAARLLVFGAQSDAAAKTIWPLVERGLVELCGPYRREDLGIILAGVDVGLVPSIWEEPYGFAGIEFLAAGIPVLGSRIGGIPDYVEHEVNGLLLPPADPAAWRAAIGKLADRPDEIKRLAGGIRPAKTMQAHLAEVFELYREASVVGTSQ